MADSTYDDLQLRGDWIKQILKKDIEAWRLRKLVPEAIEILHLDYVYNEDDLSFSLFDEAEKQRGIKGINFIDSLAEILEARHQEHKSLPSEERIKDRTIGVVAHLSNLIPMRKFLVACLRDFKRRQQPWSLTLSDIINSVDGKSHGYYLLDYASLIDIKYIITPTREIKTIHTFRDNTSYLPSQEFGWVAVLCRIFMEFLQLGGIDYYGFCPYCDDLFIVERKGRKKYCSSNCRTYASQQRKLS